MSCLRSVRGDQSGIRIRDRSDERRRMYQRTTTPHAPHTRTWRFYYMYVESILISWHRYHSFPYFKTSNEEITSIWKVLLTRVCLPLTHSCAFSIYSSKPTGTDSILQLILSVAYTLPWYASTYSCTLAVYGNARAIYNVSRQWNSLMRKSSTRHVHVAYYRFWNS